MVTKNSNQQKENNTKLSVFFDSIIENDILVQELTFKFTASNNTLSFHVLHLEGEPLSLTKEFSAARMNQVEGFIKDVLIPLTEVVNCNFFLNVKVDSNGMINFKDLHFSLTIDCRKFENPSATLHDRFRTPFQILMPFTEYIDFIAVRGFNYNIACIETEINIEVEDLMDVIQTPIVGPRAKKEWYLFIQKAAIEARKEHSIDVKIPVHDGEVTWHVPQLKTMKFIDSVRKLKG